MKRSTAALRALRAETIPFFQPSFTHSFSEASRNGGTIVCMDDLAALLVSQIYVSKRAYQLLVALFTSREQTAMPISFDSSLASEGFVTRH